MMYVLERVSGFEVCFEGEFTRCFKVLPFVNGELFMSVCTVPLTHKFTLARVSHASCE